ncbi:MAG: hypothetical protein ACRDHI_11965 [Actinomycetota bacterium]
MAGNTVWATADALDWFEGELPEYFELLRRPTTRNDAGSAYDGFMRYSNSLDEILLALTLKGSRLMTERQPRIAYVLIMLAMVAYVLSTLLLDYYRSEGLPLAGITYYNLLARRGDQASHVAVSIGGTLMAFGGRPSSQPWRCWGSWGDGTSRSDPAW